MGWAHVRIGFVANEHVATGQGARERRARAGIELTERDGWAGWVETGESRSQGEDELRL